LSKARGGSFGEIKGEEWEKVQAKRQGGKAEAPVVETPLALFKIKSEKSAETLQDMLGPTFQVTDKGGYTGNDVEVVAPNGVIFKYNANIPPSEAEAMKIRLDTFIKKNGAPIERAAANKSNVDYQTK
jgi:hypothetical protein